MKISWLNLNATAKPKQSQTAPANFSNPLKLNHLDSDKFTPSFGTDTPEILGISDVFPNLSPSEQEKKDSLKALMGDERFFAVISALTKSPQESTSTDEAIYIHLRTLLGDEIVEKICFSLKKLGLITDPKATDLDDDGPWTNMADMIQELFLVIEIHGVHTSKN